MKLRKRDPDGFTIVELLIVVIVIAILATISIVLYNGIQERARAAQVASSLRAVEKGFILMLTSQSRATWPLQSEYPDPITINTTYPPRIEWIIDNSELKGYLNDPPQLPGIVANWSYGNTGSDGSNITNCSGVYQGPILVIKVYSPAVIAMVDKSIDDGDVNCGKVRQADTVNLVYRLASNQQFP